MLMYALTMQHALPSKKEKNPIALQDLRSFFLLITKVKVFGFNGLLSIIYVFHCTMILDGW